MQTPHHDRSDIQLEGKFFPNFFRSKPPIPPEPAPVRTPAEIAEIQRNIAVIAKVFSDHPEIVLIPAPKGGYAVQMGNEAVKVLHEYLSGQRKSLDDVPDHVFRWESMIYDSEAIKTEAEENIYGAIHHENGHLHDSDPRLLVEGQKRALNDGNLPSSYCLLYNGVEDCWINIRESARSELAQRRIRACHEAVTPEIVAKIKTLPLMSQLVMSIIHYWLKGEPMQKTDKAVRKVFDEIEPHLQDYFYGETAKANAELLYEKIWPAARVLERQSILEQMARKALGMNRSSKRSSDGGSSGQPSSNPGEAQGSQGGGQPDGRPPQAPQQPHQPQQPPQQSPLQSPHQSPQSSPQQSNQPPAAGQSGGPEKKDDTPKAGDQSPLSGKSDSELKREIQERLSNPEGDPGSQFSGELSEEDQKRLLRIIESLSEAEKQELMRRAMQAVDDMHAEELAKNPPPGMQVKPGKNDTPHTIVPKEPPTKGQLKEGRKTTEQLRRDMNRKPEKQSDSGHQQEDENAVEDARRKAERQMREAGFEKDESALYREFRKAEDQARPVAQRLIRKLNTIMPHLREDIFEGHRYSGRSIDRQVLGRKAPLGDPRIYHGIESLDSERARFCLGILVDTSISMKMPPAKIAAARRACIALGMVSTHFDMPYALKSFSGTHRTILRFDQHYGDPATRAKPTLISDTMPNRLGFGTNIGDPLIELEQDLRGMKQKIPELGGLIIVISDGCANTGPTGPALRTAIAQLQARYVTVNLMLESDPAEVIVAQQYFGQDNVIVCDRYEDLPERASRILTKAFNQYMRRFAEE